MKNRTITLLAIALAFGLIAAGCGGDDDTTSTATTSSGATGATGATGAAAGEPLTKAEFVKQADAICAAGDAEIEQQTGEPSTDDIAANVQQQVDDIRALTPPEGDEEEIAHILDTAEKGVQQLEDKGDFPAPALDEATQLAKQYGFKKCGQG